MGLRRLSFCILILPSAAALVGCRPPEPERPRMPTWYETTRHGSAFRSVRDFGAVGDGAADDTAAIQAAIDHERGIRCEKKPAVVYLPAGTYRVTDTLILWKYTHLIGNPHDPPTIVLARKAPGFDDPDAKKPVITTTNGWGVDPQSRNWAANSNTLGGSANNTFYTQIHHVKVRIERGNPGAVGILWRVAQGTSIRDVTIDARDAAVGLDVGGGTDYAAFDQPPSQPGGGVIADTTIRGGRIGLRCWGSQWLFRSLRIRGQQEIGVHVRHCWNFDFIDLEVAHAPLGMRIERAMVVLLLDSRFRSIRGGQAIATDGSRCYLERVAFDGVAKALDDVIAGNPRDVVRVGAWFRGQGIADSVPMEPGDAPPARFELLPCRPRPLLDDVSIVNALDAGAAGDGEADDTQALQAAIDAHRTVFLPYGRYLVRDTLRLGKHTRLIGEGLAEIRLADRAPGFGDTAHPKPVLSTPDDPDGRTVLAGLRLTAGEGNPGAVMVEWRAGRQSGMWDVHIQPHPKTGVACELRLSGSGGGYFENMWNPGTGPVGLLGASYGPAFFYNTPFEHQTEIAYHLSNARNYTFVTAQDEQSPLALLIEDSSDITAYGLLFTYWQQEQPHLVRLSNSERIALMGLNCHNARWLVHAEPTERRGFAYPGGKGWRGLSVLRIGTR